MSRFVRQSSFRHVYGEANKKAECYDNIKISASAWDSNMVSASAKYIAVNYQASGGGAFIVIPLERKGKVPDTFPLVRGHSAPVLDTAFSPWDDSLVASAGEDGRVALTKIDESIFTAAYSTDHTVEVPDLTPAVTLSNAHARKVGSLSWHPTAEGVLASAGLEVKLWDVNKEESKWTGEVHGDMVQSFSFDWTGGALATTCKDKKLRLFDPRSSSSAVTTADSHTGVKASRVVWLGSLDRIVTTGFSKMSERQIFVWDARELSKGPVKTVNIDTSAGTLMPFWSEANKVLWVAGKGDGNIRYYEYENDDLFYLTEYSSPNPQRGMNFLPTRALNFSECEIARVFKCTGNMVEPISFYVPRKSEAFQSDLFPPAPSSVPALSSADWFGGKSASPILVDLETGKTSGSGASVATKSYASAPAPVAAAAPKKVEEPVKPKTPEPEPAPFVAEPEPEMEPVAAAAPPAPTPEPVAFTAAASSTASLPKAVPAVDNSAELEALKQENKSLVAKLDAAEKKAAEAEKKLNKIKDGLASLLSA